MLVYFYYYDEGYFGSKNMLELYVMVIFIFMIRRVFIIFVFIKEKE